MKVVVVGELVGQGSAQEQEQDHSIRNAIKDRFGSNRGIALFEAKGHEMSSPQGQCLKLADTVEKVGGSAIRSRQSRF